MVRQLFISRKHLRFAVCERDPPEQIPLGRSLCTPVPVRLTLTSQCEHAIECSHTRRSEHRCAQVSAFRLRGKVNLEAHLFNLSQLLLQPIHVLILVLHD